MPDPASTPILVTAGPTREPIDDVRAIVNRSSGRMGIALSEAAAAAGHPVTLLLGPTHLEPDPAALSADPGSAPASIAPGSITLRRYASTADLESLLRAAWPAHAILLMAAAVADYRPIPLPPGEKLRRGEGPLRIELEPTPDLVAGLDSITERHQTRIAWALEPRERLAASARAKLARKGVDAIVANPLETMDAETVAGVLVLPDGTERHPPVRESSKPVFARWLVAEAVALHQRKSSASRDR